MRGTIRSGKKLIITTVLILAVFSFVQITHASPITQENIFQLTNAIRIENNLTSLSVSEKLNEAAREKAEDMINRNYWAHSTPDGQPFWSFVNKTDYDWSYLGENLAADFKTSEGIVNAWYDSPTHRQNILNGNYEDIGIGMYQNIVVSIYGKKEQSLFSNLFHSLYSLIFIHN